jgi:hypothetical protein
MDRVLLVCQTGPMGAVDEENSHRECWESVNHKFEHGKTRRVLTIAQNELEDTGDVHRKGSEEVVIPTDTDQALRSDGSLEATEDEDGGCVWYQEANQSEKRWVTFEQCQLLLCVVSHTFSRRTKSLRQIATLRGRWLKEETLILLRTQSYGNLTAQFSAHWSNAHAVVLPHLVVNFCGVGHG